MLISDETLEQLPAPSQVGKTILGGIDCNKSKDPLCRRSRYSLSDWPFTASHLAARVRECSDADYQSRQAAYDLKKLRGKDTVRRMARHRHYEPTSTDLKALAGLLVSP